MSKNNLPLVSFVIPTRNRAKILKDCLESVIKQTYNNIEVIVVNDNSTDNTLEVLNGYSLKYPFIKYFNNNGVGVGAARNLGIDKANGDYIAFMDDDDICELNRIESQMKPIFDSNYKYDFIISSFTVLSESGKVKEIYDYLLKTESIGFTVRWLIKRDILLKAGGFDLEQPNIEEVELFFRLREIAKIYFSTVPVVKVRSSQISLTKDKSKMVDGIKRLLELHSDKMGVYEKNSWLIKLCRTYIELNDPENFYKYYLQIEKGKLGLYKLLIMLGFKTHSLALPKIYERIHSKLERHLMRKNKTYPIKIN